MQKFIRFQLHHWEIPQLSSYYCAYFQFNVSQLLLNNSVNKVMQNKSLCNDWNKTIKSGFKILFNSSSTFGNTNDSRA